MDKSTIAKYLAGAGLLGSVFALVLIGKADAAQYIGMVTMSLAGLGIGVATAFKPDAPKA